MNTNQTPDMGDLLKGVMENPEMLKRIMDIAGGLSKSGILNNLMSSDPAQSDSTPKTNQNNDDNNNGHNNSHNNGTNMPPVPPAEPHSNKSDTKNDYTKHKRLLEAIRLYVNPDKADKIDMAIKMLGLLDIARNMGISIL